MKRFLLIILNVLAISMSVSASDYDKNTPFGFCMRSSRTDATSTYNCSGGGCYTYPIPDDFTGKVVVLKSNGQDMKSAIQDAIKQNDVIILDGSEGEFIVSSNISVDKGDKTILGINDARLCTLWHMTDEIKAALDAAGVPQMSTSSGTGGKLTNGQSVSEQAEYNTRQIIINLTGDESESYRKSGIMIIDGMDGNFDITQSSDFNTVSWCTFSYTDRSYMHQNTNLVGSSDSEATGFLNTTYAFNWWGTGCKQRMPMARVGKIHMLNNYFSSTTASNCINPRKSSEFLIEGNYFESGVKKWYSQSGASAVTWRADNYIAESKSLPASLGSEVTVPYTYTVAPYSDVPEAVKSGAGATLFADSPTGINELSVFPENSTDNSVYTLSGQRACGSYKGIVIVNGKKYYKH